MKRITLLLTAILSINLSFAQIDKVWNTISENDYKKAQADLQNLTKDQKTAIDASILALALKPLTQTSNESKDIELMKNIMANCEDASPYLFALWYTSAVTDGMGENTKARGAFLEELLESSKVNTSIKAGLNYSRALHHTYTYNSKNRNKQFNAIGAIKNWQFTGVFDNTSGSGFNKGNEQLSHPEPNAKFTSKMNASVSWFIPEEVPFDPWITFENTMPSTQGVIFAQTFINNPVDQDVALKLGGEGAMKLWINDKLIFSEEEEQRTELDYYTTHVKLPKGNNRILIQLSHTNKSNYPNFMLRFLDINTNQLVTNLQGSSTYTKYNTKESVTILKENVPHFAEHYFENKIKADSSNLINYYLLSKCYGRAKKNNHALKILDLAVQRDPNNILLNIEQLVHYQKISDRTALMLQIENLRKINPNLYMLKVYDYETALEKENNLEAEDLLKEIAELTGVNNSDYLSAEIDLLSAKKEYNEMYEKIDEAFEKYPNNSEFINYKFHIQKNRDQSGARAVGILEKHLSKHYNYNLQKTLMNEYQELGFTSKITKMLLENVKNHPGEIDFQNSILHIYYNQANYVEALKYTNKMIGISPYDATSYINKGYILLALEKENEAKESFKLAIEHNPNSFESREKLRMLNELDPWTEIVKNENAYPLIKKSFNIEEDNEDQYDFVFYEVSNVIFEEGAGVEFSSLGIRILNKSGIDTWKEMSVPYNYNSENLVITKAEINKPNGQKLEGEQNGSQIVFTNLEVGDIIYLEFRKDKYTWGKLAKEITKTYSFSNFVPTYNSLYRLYTPKDFNVKITEQNLTATKKEYVFEEYNCKEYRHEEIKKVDDENYMPKLSEIGETIYISTMKDWSVISNWYKDLAMPMAREDYNIEKVFNEIFENNLELSDKEKAEKIYNYLCKNVSYSSVSFRQSNFVPQKPMVTISTKLGDCKDLSVLYYTLAKKAGLKTNLVLVNTIDNGVNSLKIPSTNFNHCIVRIEVDKDTLFQELTDNKLPFGSLPNHIANAQALVIYENESDNNASSLIHIPEHKWISNSINRDVTVTVTDDVINIKTDINLIGSNASEYRWYLSDLTQTESKKTINKYCASYFDGDVKVLNYDIGNLDSINSAFDFSIEMELEDEIKSIGSLSTFTVPFFDKIFSIDVFPNEERKFPLNYWDYESIDNYKSTVNIKVDSDTKIAELPENITINNKFIEFKIEVKQISESEIQITRTVKPLANIISEEDYVEFRKVVKQISKSEDTFIAIKKK